MKQTNKQNNRKLGKFASKNNENAKVELNIITELLNDDDDDDDNDEDDNTMLEESKKSETRFSLHPEHSKSLLSVPSIYVDNLDSASSISVFDTSSSTDDRSMMEMDTVSMIVRNVKLMDSNFSETELVKHTPLSSSHGVVVKSVAAEVASKNDKKHDFYHDLKGKFHHLVHHENSKKEFGGGEHSKPKEILHDLKENVSGKLHQFAEKMHHIHLPHMHHHSNSNNTHDAHEDSLVTQAMQMILMEKFNIAEASTLINDTDLSSQQQQLKRKSSSSSLESIKQKFNLFQRPQRRSVELPSETSSLKSISEINSLSGSENIDIVQQYDENFSCAHEEVHSIGSYESTTSTITVIPTISKDDLKLSVEKFDSFTSSDNSSSAAKFIADTNKKPLHASLLSISSRNELLSASPKTHARTESIGCKFSGSPSKQSACIGEQRMSGSLPTASTAIYRRSSDSDLSITPKGK